MELATTLGTIMTQRIARGIEIANYLLLLPASCFPFTFLRRPPVYAPDLLLTQFAPITFWCGGLLLHILYFQHARSRIMAVTPKTLWWLSMIYNLILALYLWNFGSFVTLVFIWPLCVAFLSLASLIDVYRQTH